MRELVLAVIDVALIGGLLWSLWFVCHSIRRRRKQIAEQLTAPIVRTPELLVIAVNRKEWIASSLPMILMTAVALEALITGKTAVGLVMLLVFGPLLFVSGREVMRRRPALVLDAAGITVLGWKGITLTPVERRISWDSIQKAWVKQRTSFGVTRHELMCELAPSEQVEVPLEKLSIPWNDVVRAIQDHFGSRVLIPTR